MMVSPRWMPRPMPYGAPSVSSASTTSTADIFLPSMPVGRPFSKWMVCFAGARRIRERVLRQHPGRIRNAALGGQCFLAANGDAPQAAIDGIRGAVRRQRQIARRQIVQLFLALERLVAHRRDHLELRRERAHRHFEAHLVIAGRRAAVRDGIRAELARHERDLLRLHDALRAHAQWIELSAAHVAHDEETQHLLEVIRARVDLVVRDGAVRLASAPPASSRPRRRCRRCPR